jgi:hypothetical protein
MVPTVAACRSRTNRCTAARKSSGHLLFTCVHDLPTARAIVLAGAVTADVRRSAKYMKTKPHIICFLTIVVTAGSTACMANNNLFLPGDAFFPTVLTKAGIEAIQTAKKGERQFAYSSFGGYEGAFCGYAGYDNAIIPAVDDDFAKNLASVYSRIREFEGRQILELKRNGKTELLETNGIRVLFYPPEFEFPRHRLGLRYNEDWVSEALKFGHKKEHLRLCCLIADQAAVERSWRDANVIPALNVELPDVQLKPVPVTKLPVVVQGSVKAIVIGSHSLKELFSYNDDDYLAIYIVDSKGITELVHEDGKWGPADSN